MRSSVVQVKAEWLLLRIKRSLLMWFGYIRLREDLGPEPGQAGEMMSLGFPPGELEEVAGGREV